MKIKVKKTKQIQEPTDFQYKNKGTSDNDTNANRRWKKMILKPSLSQMQSIFFFLAFTSFSASVLTELLGDLGTNSHIFPFPVECNCNGHETKSSIWACLFLDHRSIKMSTYWYLLLY